MDWGKILKGIRDSLVAASREVDARRRAGQHREGLSERLYEPNCCLFWDCGIPIRSEHVFCYKHFQNFQEGLIDECPGCGQAKDTQYQVCLECHRNAPPQPASTTPSAITHNYRWYKPEYSPSWEPGDATADRFFVYILKLDGGRFYAGQTRELRERLSEHRDGRTKSTAGGNPKLVWFEIVDSRDAAAAIEVELKKLIDSNPREVRRMVLSFRDLVQELDFG